MGKNRTGKRFMGLFAALIFMLSAAAPVLAAEEAEMACAELSVGNEIGLKNIDKLDFYGQAGHEIVNRGGRNGIRMDPKQNCLYMVMFLDKELFPKNTDGESVEVTVDYYDEGNGFFTLRYDSPTNRTAGVTEDSHDIIRMGDTKEWKSYTFYVDDAAFGSVFSDFCIGMWSNYTGGISPEAIIVGNVRMEKCLPREPVSAALSTEHLGNIFGGSDEKNLTWELQNKAPAKLDIKGTYCVYDEDGRRLQTDTYRKTLNVGEKGNVEWTAKIEDYGVYKVALENEVSYVYNNVAQTTKVSRVFDFSVMNKLSPEDPKNDKMAYCAHIDTWWRDPDKTLQIAAWTGASRFRDEILWQDLEKNKGEYDFDSRIDMRPAIDDKGVGFHFLGTYSNPNYSCYYKDGVSSKTGIPITEEDRQAFADYMIAVMDRYEGRIDSVEVWNEPNLDVFNGHNRTAQDYAELLKTCYKRIKEKYPDVKVASMGLSGVDIDYAKQVFDAGGYDYCDAVAVHPYQWSGVFSTSIYENQQRRLIDLMKEYGPLKEVWNTEMGWTTGKNVQGGVTQEKQAIYMLQEYFISVAQGLADRIYWYDIQNDGIKIEDQENNFGVVGNNIAINTFTDNIYEAPEVDGLNLPWGAKQSAIALAQLNKVMTDAVFEESIRSDDEMRAYRFKGRDGSSVSVIWSIGKDVRDTSIDIDGDAVLYDMYGNEIGRTSGGRIFAEVGERPFYIIGSYNNCTLAEAEMLGSSGNISVACGEEAEFKLSDIKSRDLEVKIDCPEAIEWEEELTDKAKGEVRLRFKTKTNTKSGTYKISGRLYEGDTFAGILNIVLEVTDPFRINIAESSIAGTLDRFKAEVTITNLGRDKPISGSCKITEPEEAAAAGNIAKFSNLRPGESTTVNIMLPRTVEKRYYDIRILTELDNGISKISEKDIRLESKRVRMMNGDIVILKKLKGSPPKIDGVMEKDEWNQTPIVVKDKKMLKEFKDYRGEDDIGFEARLAWDENYMYICVDAEDNVFSQEFSDSEMWQGDSVQIGTAEGEPSHLKSVGFNETAIGLLSNGPAMYRFMSNTNLPIGKMTNGEVAIKRSDTNTVYEARLPWSELISPGFVPKEGMSMAFSMILNDNDGDGRKGWIEYTDGIGSTKNAMLFKCLDFAE